MHDMDWQTPEDTVPSSVVTDAQVRSLLGKPPVTGAWREGDPPGDRLFAQIGTIAFEYGGEVADAKIAYETQGHLSPSRNNAVLVLHALTGDAHLTGRAGPGQPTDGWWGGIVGPGRAIDTDKWFVVSPNMLGGCQGSTGPATLAPNRSEWSSSFPFMTIRDQVRAQAIFSDVLGIDHWAAVIGGSMGGMHALEWAIQFSERVARVAIIAAPPATSADQIALNSLQIEAIKADPLFRSGQYYDAVAGDGPHRGLALARRMALLNYRSPTELNNRFKRGWQSDISPLGRGGRFAVESYLDFHGNKFTRRFDANSYITLVEAMNSHDVGRDRGGIDAALARIGVPALILGIDGDRLFPVDEQHRIARHAPGNINEADAVVISSAFGHDGFLIESELVGAHIRQLLEG